MMKENNPTTPPLTIDELRQWLNLRRSKTAEIQLQLVANDFLNNFTSPSVLYIPNINLADLPTVPNPYAPADTALSAKLKALASTNPTPSPSNSNPTPSPSQPCYPAVTPTSTPPPNPH